jgi:hypothetical protein
MTTKAYPSELQDRFIVRLPDGMRDEIARAAKANGRSMNAEVVARLSAPNMGAMASDVIGAITLLQQQVARAEVEEVRLCADMGIVARCFLMCIDELPNDAIDPDTNFARDLKEWRAMAEQKYLLAEAKVAKTDVVAMVERLQMLSEQADKMFPDAVEPTDAPNSFANPPPRRMNTKRNKTQTKPEPSPEPKPVQRKLKFRSSDPTKK